MFYNARYYSPLLGRFISADSIVPGAADGSGGGAGTLGYDSHTRLTPLTTDFHEFIAQVGSENAEVLQYGPFFQWSGKVRQEHNVPMGPLNPQALNRYSYVLNNPLRYVDPTGHYRISLSAAQIQQFIDLLTIVRGNWQAGGTVGGGLLGLAAKILGTAPAIFAEVATWYVNSEMDGMIDVLNKAKAVALSSPDGLATIKIDPDITGVMFDFGCVGKDCTVSVIVLDHLAWYSAKDRDYIRDPLAVLTWEVLAYFAAENEAKSEGGFCSDPVFQSQIGINFSR